MKNRLIYGLTALALAALVANPVSAQQFSNPTGGSGGGAPSGAAGGDLTGSYPNPSVGALNGNSIPAGALADQIAIGTAANTLGWKTVPNCASVGYSTASHALNCAYVALPQMQFFSPAQTTPVTGSGAATTYTYTLPSTTTGHLHYKVIGNGGPGGGGALNSGAIRTGGGGGAPGQKKEWDQTIVELVAAYPGITGITVSFPALGTPGAAQTTATSVGNAGTPSASGVQIRSNTSGTPLMFTVKVGGAGQGGQINGTTAGTGGSAPDGGQPSGGSSIAAGTLTLGASDALAGPSPGGAGGGLNAANAETVGAAAGNALDNPYSTKGAASTPVETSGASALTPYTGGACIGGIGGNGGGASNSTSVAGGNGGAGTGYGAPGGGGGGGTNTSGSGAGGAATFGCAEITYYPY